MTITETPRPGDRKADLDTPALIVDLDILEGNIRRMAGMVAGTRAALRPHVKSHKTIEVAKLQLALGAGCAKLGEAEALADGGIPDLLVTTPVAGRRKLDRLRRLAASCRLSVVADDADSIAALSEAMDGLGTPLGVIVEVNVGQERCGVEPGPEAARLAALVSRLPGLRFAGLQGYHGKLQSIAEHAVRKREVALALDRLLDSAEAVRQAGIEVPVLTGGGTGSSAIDLELAGLSELQPGSYVYMDTSYSRVVWDAAGSQIPFGNSLSILASVVSRAAADRLVLDVGWKSASSDSGLPQVRYLDDVVFEFAGDEHGKLQGSEARSLRPGDKVELLPSHCDTTVNLYDQIVAVRGEHVEAVWPIVARGRSQ